MSEEHIDLTVDDKASDKINKSAEALERQARAKEKAAKYLPGGSRGSGGGGRPPRGSRASALGDDDTPEERKLRAAFRVQQRLRNLERMRAATFVGPPTHLFQRQEAAQASRQQRMADRIARQQDRQQLRADRQNFVPIQQLLYNTYQAQKRAARGARQPWDVRAQTRTGNLIQRVLQTVGGGGVGGGGGGGGGGMGFGPFGRLARVGLRVARALGVPRTVLGGLILFGLALNIAIRAAHAFVKQLAESVVFMAGVGHAALMGGGSIGTSSMLAARGVPIGAMAQMAASIHQTLTTPLGRLAAQRLGMNQVLPRPFGSPDELSTLQTVLERLRAVSNLEERITLARMAGAEGLLELTMVSDAVWQRQTLVGRNLKEVLSPAMMQRMRDLAGEARNLNTAWQTLKFQMVAGSFGPMKGGIRGATNLFTNLSAIGKLFEFLNNPIAQTILTPAPLLPLMQLMQLLAHDWGLAAKDHAAAMKAHSRSMTPGKFGGGERFRGALAPGLTGDQLRRAVEEGAELGGAWAL